VLAYLEIRNFKSVTEKRKRRRLLWGTYCYPLHCAAEENNVEMVHLLLAAGADKTATNSSGQTPLDLVTELQRNPGQESYVEVIKALR
jgi:imidazole glycerol phosphate synthase subunit HisF